MDNQQKMPNRLIHESSPYLLQHAYNPVDWYPWGEEAFQKAEEEDKPVLLSSGYSACHWCHVMEKESFADPEVASLLNKVFVPIKVDREERPDIDGVYMSACQAMTGSGGWPLTVMLTPDRKPFFAGTYFPKRSAVGRIGLMELAEKVKTLWNTRREAILKIAEDNTSILEVETAGFSEKELGPDALDQAFQQLTMAFDEQYGGFGIAPKFPTPHNLCFLMRYWKRAGRQEALRMVEKTLTSIRYGGIYDQLGYGFHRYATDRGWLFPHFEKMLYDQALLVMAYLEAYQVTGAPLYRQTLDEVFTYLVTVMRDENGGFYTAEDADSEGVEGRFYLWKSQEIQDVLSAEEEKLVTLYFNLKQNGNYQEENSGENILYLTVDLSEVAKKMDIPPQKAEELLRSARERLYSIRERRVRPHKDDKILIDWNGLLLAALAKGARILKEIRWRETAEKTADFLLSQMRRAEGGLWHRYRKGEAGVPGFLEDYVFFIYGLLELYETTFETKYLTAALDLNAFLRRYFLDEEKGGFFQLSTQSEEVLVRKKEVYDGALPSGNSVMALNLLRLSRFTGDNSFLEEAQRILRAFSALVLTSPANHTQFLSALDFALGPSQEIVIVGQRGEETTERMLAMAQERFIPNKVILFRAADEETPEIIRVAPFTSDLTAIDGKATAYVCQNYQCAAPTCDPERLLQLLAGEA